MYMSKADVATYGDLSAPRFADFHGIGNQRVRAFVDAKKRERRDVCATFGSVYFAGIVDDEAASMRRIDRLEARLL